MRRRPLNRHLGSIRTLAAVLAVTFALVGCRYSTNAYRLLTKKPSVADVSGIYALSVETVSGVIKPKPNFSKSRLILHSDFRCELVEFPDWREESSDFQGIPLAINFTGTYRIDIVGSVAGFWNDKPCYGVIIESVGHAPIHANLAQGKPLIEVVIEYGDPDEWRFSIWRKSEEPKKPPL